MSKLDEFLSVGKCTDVQEDISVKLGGKDFTLKIRAMSEDEHKEWQKRAMNISKKGSVSFDSGKYNQLMIPACIVEPNFNDAAFLEKAKCQTAWEFICSRFPAGVLENISQKIQELSGFDSLDAEIEEAKN